MPLPFLTADRAFDTTDAVALPFDDHDQWRRPYRPGPYRVGAAALALLLASFVLLAAVIIVAAGSFGGGIATFAFAALIILASLRLLRMGTWVSRAGVRRVGFFATTTTPWAKVGSVRTAQQPVRWLNFPRTVQGQALVLDRAAGERLLLLTDHNADFLSRSEAFDRAADTVEAWHAEYGVRR
ncbi:hypothetical protein [Streptomyces termitum]|uniref:hypothetical protein n=1 Tax=Streptomyces termitum TaxID=67368 RepID=UPI00339E650D